MSGNLISSSTGMNFYRIVSTSDSVSVSVSSDVFFRHFRSLSLIFAQVPTYFVFTAIF